MPVNDRFTSDSLASLCVTDGEFGLAARYWRGGLRLESGPDFAAVRSRMGP